jgi:hypothetical protein
LLATSATTGACARAASLFSEWFDFPRFHLTCIQLTREEANCIEQYICEPCGKKNKRVRSTCCLLLSLALLIRLLFAAMYKNENTLKAEIKQMDYDAVHKERINIEKMLKEMAETEVIDTGDFDGVDLEELKQELADEEAGECFSL